MAMNPRSVLRSAVLLLVPAASNGWAQVPLGPEVQVNVYTTGTQDRPSVAADAAGRFVVVWQGAAQDGSSYGILGRGFDASGAPGSVSDLQVNEITTGLQWARFYFDPNGFDPGEAQLHRRTRIFIGFEEGPNRRLFAVVLRRQAGEYAVRARVRRDDHSQRNTPFFPISDDPHWVELEWRRASGPDANDGSFQLWLDGASVFSESDLDNSISALDFARLGALSVKSGASGTLYWDEFESRRLSLIGP